MHKGFLPLAILCCANVDEMNDLPTPVNRHVKLTRILDKSALKSFHPELLNYRHFAGELWSDRDGYNCRNQKATFCQQGKYQFDSPIVKVIANHGQEAFKDGS